jgi:hypothetical protein
LRFISSALAPSATVLTPRVSTITGIDPKKRAARRSSMLSSE